MDGAIDILHCDDLILFKLLAGRMIDRADAAMLLRENRDAIDLSYLRDWAARLALDQELNRYGRRPFREKVLTKDFPDNADRTMGARRPSAPSR